jgi:hypothetical protein
VLAEGREMVAEALVVGKMIRIHGGSYTLAGVGKRGRGGLRGGGRRGRLGRHGV